MSTLPISPTGARVVLPPQAASCSLQAARHRCSCLSSQSVSFRLTEIKNPTLLGGAFIMLALPIFPASHPASIVGADELNFCVRDGNRWTLIAINTNCISSPLQLSLPGELPYYTALFSFVKRFFAAQTLLLQAASDRLRKLPPQRGFLHSQELVTRTGFEPMLMA